MNYLKSFLILGLLSINTTAFGQYTYYQACPTGTCPNQVQVQQPVRYYYPQATQPVQYYYTQPVQYAQQAVVQPQTAPVAAPATTQGGSDPYGFLNWLNGVRASYGLCLVGYDANLSNWAAMNNNAQLASGLGHFVMGPARRQNSAWNTGFPGPMWMASPGHRAALLDPTIQWIGIATAGAYWTFSAY
jgi:uncharacterized protein YkwD